MSLRIFVRPSALHHLQCSLLHDRLLYFPLMLIFFIYHCTVNLYFFHNFIVWSWVSICTGINFKFRIFGINCKIVIAFFEYHANIWNVSVSMFGCLDFSTGITQAHLQTEAIKQQSISRVKYGKTQSVNKQYKWYTVTQARPIRSSYRYSANGFKRPCSAITIRFLSSIPFQLIDLQFCDIHLIGNYGRSFH